MGIRSETIDKKSWKVGPWSSEPDEVDWIDEVTGYQCYIKRTQMMGTLCGYVRVPDDHLLYGYNSDTRIEMLREEVELHEDFGAFEVFMEALSGERDGTVPISLAFKVHGNITWAGPIANREGWWFGFDRGHCNDFAPGTTNISPKFQEVMESLAEAFGNTLVYRDIEYVTKECQSLAEQLNVGVVCCILSPEVCTLTFQSDSTLIEAGIIRPISVEP